MNVLIVGLFFVDKYDMISGEHPVFQEVPSVMKVIKIFVRVKQSKRQRIGKLALPSAGWQCTWS